MHKKGGGAKAVSDYGKGCARVPPRVAGVVRTARAMIPGLAASADFALLSQVVQILPCDPVARRREECLCRRRLDQLSAVEKKHVVAESLGPGFGCGWS